MIVDIHSHIISGIDDGPKNIEMTLEMLKNAERDGTKEIIATPHYLLSTVKLLFQKSKYLLKKLIPLYIMKD